MFIEFTEEQKRRANEADLVSLLERNGQQAKRVGSQFEWSHNGQTVSINNNLWYDQYEQVGGNTVSFVMKFFNLPYPDAVKFILDGDTMQLSTESSTSAKVTKTEAPDAPFKLPERNSNMKRAFAYLLKTRCINWDVIRSFAQEGLIYESAKYHNVVFVGKDKDGVPRHAHKRTTASDKVWRANEHGSDNRYTFNWRGSSNRVFLFEAPIDMLSYITMYCPGWSEDSFIAACSVSDTALNKFIEDRPDITQVYICFDNDPPGQKGAETIRQRLTDTGINCEILVPTLKDWNEDLLNSAQEEGESICREIT